MTIHTGSTRSLTWERLVPISCDRSDRAGLLPCQGLRGMQAVGTSAADAW